MPSSTTVSVADLLGRPGASRPVRVDVAELYSDPDAADDPDEVEAGYEVRDDAIDLDALLRDALAPAVPVAPHCREDCAGLCAQCGADLNAGPHAHHEQTADPRWSALAALRLDPDRER